MKKHYIMIITIALYSSSLFAAAGMQTVTSKHDVKTTADKLEAALKAKGMKIFLRLDHAAGAAGIGKTLRPTELIVFGNPKLGTALMSCAQTAGIDLPMKALIFRTESGEVKLAYNTPAYLQERHHIKGCEKPLAKASGALANFARAATQ